MKRILFSCFAAVVAVGGLSAFLKKDRADDLYYFAVIEDRLPGGMVSPHDVLFIDYGTVPEYMCPEPMNNSYLCVIGITVNALTHINYTNLAHVVYGITIATRTGS